MEIIDSDQRLVAGWANVEVVDMQGEVIPVETLRKAMLKYMDMGGPIIVAHTNKQVGKVLQWEIKKHPTTKSDGLWIVAKIDKLYPFHDEVWEAVKRGEFKGFSVGGRGARKVVKLKPEFRGSGLPEEVKVLDNLELFEISLAPTPANQFATIEAISVAKNYEPRKLTLKELLEKYDVGEYLLSDENCRLCGLIKQIYEESGDIETAVRVGYALFQKEMGRMEKRRLLESEVSRLSGAVSKLRESLEKVEPSEEEQRRIWEKWYKMIEQSVQKLMEEVRKPFGAWSSFDDCVKDMKSKGYGEDSARRICGSLQAKLEKSDVAKWHKFAEEALEHIDMAIEVLESAGEDRFGEVLDSLEEACDSLYQMVLSEVGEEGLDEEGEEVDVESLSSLASKSWFRKDKRPPKRWWDRCVEETGRPALCGWVYYHHLKPYKPGSKRTPDEPHTAEARERKRRTGA